GAVLQWWRSALFALLGWAAWLVPLALGAIALELWFGFIRRETVLPILGGIVIIVALLGLTRQVTRTDAAGGVVGGGIAKAAGRAPVARGPSEVEPPPDSARQPFAVSTAGLASAAVIAEGVLHADPPEKPWVLPALDSLDQGSAARSGKDELIRNKRVIEETLSHFGIAASVVDVFVGPVVTRYELK